MGPSGLQPIGPEECLGLDDLSARQFVVREKGAWRLRLRVAKAFSNITFMHAVEFIAELNEVGTLHIPREVAKDLPCSGKARVILLTADADGDAAWQAAAYQQFLRDDAPEDAIYESLAPAQ
jgi:hypothetical protein